MMVAEAESVQSHIGPVAKSSSRSPSGASDPRAASTWSRVNASQGFSGSADSGSGLFTLGAPLWGSAGAEDSAEEGIRLLGVDGVVGVPSDVVEHPVTPTRMAAVIAAVTDTRFIRQTPFPRSGLTLPHRRYPGWSIRPRRSRIPVPVPADARVRRSRRSPS